MFHEPVTTSATGKPQRASDAPANMEIITQDDIRRSGATTIPDVLQFVTGVDVRRYGIVGRRCRHPRLQPAIQSAPAGAGERPRRSIRTITATCAWSTIPVQLDEIRQIEVIKGPNSALYGFNAVSGVINIITYDPLRDRSKHRHVARRDAGLS